jgi:hypothetical protein
VKKAVFVVTTVVILVLALSSVALAATPQDIYYDYAADQKLDGTYTNAELQAYLADPWVDQYGDPAIVAVLDTVVAGLMVGPTGGDDDGRGEFPFTGAQLALLALAAVALVGGGVGLSRLARSRA